MIKKYFYKIKAKSDLLLLSRIKQRNILKWFNFNMKNYEIFVGFFCILKQFKFIFYYFKLHKEFFTILL